VLHLNGFGINRIVLAMRTNEREFNSTLAPLILLWFCESERWRQRRARQGTNLRMCALSHAWCLLLCASWWCAWLLGVCGTMQLVAVYLTL